MQNGDVTCIDFVKVQKKPIMITRLYEHAIAIGLLLGLFMVGVPINT